MIDDFPNYSANIKRGVKNVFSFVLSVATIDTGISISASILILLIMMIIKIFAEFLADINTVQRTVFINSRENL